MAFLSSDETCRAFLEAQGVELASSAAPDAALAAALDVALDLGVKAWPDLVPDRAGFAVFLGQRVPSDINAPQALGCRAPDELYLAFACLAGNPDAHRHLDERYVTPLIGWLAAQGIAPELSRDTVQWLRVKLLTGERPLLRAFSGLGTLKGWLRVTTLRQAIRAQRQARASEGEEVSEALADATQDPALQYQRRLYQDEFRRAFGLAVAGLSVRERNLLKQSVLFGATVDDLGALYQIHRSTAARWIAAARTRLAEQTREHMIAQLGLQDADYESILQLIHSQLDVSVTRLLGEPAAAL
jgi:RNA polymerase sigma-70 factor, ECF subfamily